MCITLEIQKKNSSTTGKSAYSKKIVIESLALSYYKFPLNYVLKTKLSSQGIINGLFNY